MTLDISESEEELLKTLLARFVAETRSEIYRTETAAFKDGLKRQETNAQNLLAKLRAGEKA